ncbi:MAG: prephenate dehydratase [Solirubrobacteraceae bacterium]
MSAAAEAEPSRGRAGYLGPAGTFSEEALLSGAVEGSVEPVALPSIPETVRALLRGEVRWAVVPIENSLEGSIGVTLDLLAGEGAQTRIVGETRLRISHALIGPEPVALEEIRTVVSHPAVPGQCGRFLGEQLARAEVLPASSTAEAVRAVVAGGDRTRAALGTALAGEIYGGTVLRAGVEDRADNETRFAWLARAEHAALRVPLRASGGVRRCAVVFWGAGAERSGWLVRCLAAFAQREINLVRIESRPQRSVMGAYMFFAELDGDAAEANVKEALQALGTLCEHVAVLGSYAAAEPSVTPVS